VLAVLESATGLRFAQCLHSRECGGGRSARSRRRV